VVGYHPLITKITFIYRKEYYMLFRNRGSG
jgi:hypothetical protein